METKITDSMVQQHGLSKSEYSLIREKLGRQPNLCELGIFSVMWSEHCGYKHSRRLLKDLPTQGPAVLQGPGENAGVVDLGDGLAAAFKIESHNHPSAVEPFQGAATGVGGILRDIFTMGARPIANLNSLRFGPLKDPATAWLAREVVRGIGYYGNCVGVPTVAGDIVFDPGYRGNPLVNAMTVGLVSPERILKARAEVPGHPVVYIGATTGRDGIHGATFASADLSDDTASQRSAVQVADPFLEKLLIEATLELAEAGFIMAIQDMGAAGLTSSSVEMAFRGRQGIRLNLDNVPRREPGMSPYEILLSESQERMLLVVHQDHMDRASKILQKWGLHFAQVGHVEKGDHLIVSQGGKVAVDLPVDVLAEAPMYKLEGEPSDEHQKRLAFNPEKEVELPPNAGEALLSLVGSPNLCSRQPLYSQYDTMVRTDTVIGPGCDAAVLRIKGRTDHLAMTVDGNGRHGLLDPWVGGAVAVAEGARNLACVGAKVLGLTDCLNFGNPERPEPAWQFRRSLLGLGEACRILGVPVVGGNVSFYNEGPDGSIPPTPIVGLLGQIPSGVKPVPSYFAQEGDTILRLGWDCSHLGGTEYLSVLGQGTRGQAPPLDLIHEKSLDDFLCAAAAQGLFVSAHDVSDGGIAVTLVESCLSSVTVDKKILGARVENLEGTRWDGSLFGEGEARVVASCRPDRLNACRDLAKDYKVPLEIWGKVGGSTVEIGGRLKVPLDRLLDSWQNGLGSIFGN